MLCQQCIDFSIWPEQTGNFLFSGKLHPHPPPQLSILQVMMDYDSDSYSPEHPPCPRKTRDEVDISQVLPT